jgi:hypothetical protein
MKEKYLGTILVLVVALVIVFFFYRNMNILYAAVALSCISLFIPWIGMKVHWLWMKFAEGIGFVMNKLILSIIFFIFLLPVALLSKLFRKEAFKAKKNDRTSYFTERNFTYTKKSLEELW